MLDNLRRLVRYRGLISSLVARELKARYRGSALGFFWSFINPLMLLSIYSFVFKVILPGTHSNEVEPFALFMFCGILPWTWFTSSLSESAGSLISGGNLIKKVLFPAEILPLVSVLANMVHFLLGLPILIAFLFYFRRWPDGPDLFWFPVTVLVQLIFTSGLALMLSALTVHFRDIRDILSNVLTLWFFSTPIIYWIKEAPGLGKQVLDLNPMTHIIVSYQEILFFTGPIGHWRWLLATGAASVGLFLAGLWLFDRLRDSFAESV
jgi:ABC-type polysaccharide/polyol phosphate export permease